MCSYVDLLYSQYKRQIWLNNFYCQFSLWCMGSFLVWYFTRTKFLCYLAFLIACLIVMLCWVHFLFVGHALWILTSLPGSLSYSCIISFTIFPWNRRQGTRVFHSASISERRDAVTLKTEDGITITVHGHLNRTRTIENGFPQEVLIFSSLYLYFQWSIQLILKQNWILI